MSILKKILPKPLFYFLRRKYSMGKLYAQGFYFTHVHKVYRNKGLTIHVPFEMTDLRFRASFINGQYEREEAKYLAEYLPKSAKIIELGGCLGYVSCMANEIIEDKSQHVVLEANPNLIAWIEKNKNENNAGFTVENKIISTELVNTFYISNSIVSSSIKRETEQKITVEGISFEKLAETYQIDFNTLLMDIEGGELMLLRNHQESLSKLSRIMFEIHPFNGILTELEAQECEEILAKIGFKKILEDGYFQIWEK